MQTLPLIITSISLIAAVINLVAELRRDLMMLQQNSYRRERYFRWISTSGDTTSMPRLLAMAVFFGSMMTYMVPLVGASFILIFALSNAVRLLRAHYKKPLVLTQRATRLLITSNIISVIVLISALWLASLYIPVDKLLYAAAIILTGEYCASHIILTLANWILKPVEKHINQRYYNEAKNILSAMPNLKIVGITGSYGKTSTKHYLYTILSEQFETVMTPGSFNTTLGVVRTVREHLKPYTEVFIVEMGAKQLGDIREICDLVNPQTGIITAVGKMHLETFGSIENICSTKFELADSLPSDGLAVINNDYEHIAGRKVNNVPTVRYAIDNPESADAVGYDLRVSERGTSFKVAFQGKEMDFSTKLVGRCNVSNLIAAIIVALNLGMDEESIRKGVARIEQVEHRLSIKRGGQGTIILDDAFNSNPIGSAMALEVLASIDSGKRIIVTPGMIELGDRQYDENFKFGQKIATSADIAIVVGEYNRIAITEGIKSQERQPQIHEAATFADAQRILSGIIGPGDAILYENDLPDTFK